MKSEALFKLDVALMADDTLLDSETVTCPTVTLWVFPVLLLVLELLDSWLFFASRSIQVISRERGPYCSRVTVRVLAPAVPDISAMDDLARRLTCAEALSMIRSVLSAVTSVTV